VYRLHQTGFHCSLDETRLQLVQSQDLSQTYAIELNHLTDPDSRADAIGLLLSVSTECFAEPQLAIMADAMPSLTALEMLQILSHVRTILLHHSSQVCSHSSAILPILSPLNCESEAELLSSAFASLSLVCCNVEKLNEDEMRAYLSVVLEFAVHAVQINMSLSALGIIWDFTPFVHNMFHFWKRILTDMLIFSITRGRTSPPALSRRSSPACRRT
jgi:hypothetical protein